MKRLDLLLVAVAVAGACGDPFNRIREHQPAILRRLATDSIDFTAPDTVALATNFNVTVTTYGGSCDLKGETNLFTVAADSAHFVPVNITETSNGTCPEEDLGLVRTFPHSATLQFTQAGAATVVIFGRDESGAEMIRSQNVFVRQP